MALRSLCLVLSLYLLGIVQCDHPGSETNDPNVRKTRVQVKVPNFLNDLVPNFEKLTEDLAPKAFNPNPVPFLKDKQGENVAPPHIHRIRDNYQTLREFVHSALMLGNRNMNTDGLFALDLRNSGSNTKLNVDTVFGKISLNAKAPTTKSPDHQVDFEKNSDSTEVPLNEYLNNLLEESTKRLGDFSMNVRDPNGRQVASVRNSKTRTRLNVLSPVEVSVDSRARADSIKRSGFLPPQTDEDIDPEEEYLRHAEDLHRKNLKLRGYNIHFIDIDDLPQSTTARLARPITQTLGDPILRTSMKRKVHPFSRRKDPIKKMTEYYYNLSTGKSEKNPEDEDETFDEYIEDLEEVTGTLREDSKVQLKAAFKQFKRSLERIDFGDNVDISKLMNEPEDVHSWVPRRIVDQKDLEIAFLNIDKKEKPNIGDKMILAFTLTGVPLKIYMDSSVRSPIEFLHKYLSEAGVTLNVPVKTFKEMEPISGEVLHVGANNQGKLITRAMSIIIPRVEKIPSYVNRFSKANTNVLSAEETEETLTQAVQKLTTSESELKFSDVLAESYKRQPNQVLDDIIKFLEKSPISKANTALPDVTVETEN